MQLLKTANIKRPEKESALFPSMLMRKNNSNNVNFISCFFVQLRYRQNHKFSYLNKSMTASEILLRHNYTYKSQDRNSRERFRNPRDCRVVRERIDSYMYIQWHTKQEEKMIFIRLLHKFPTAKTFLKFFIFEFFRFLKQLNFKVSSKLRCPNFLRDWMRMKYIYVIFLRPT